MWLPVLAVCTGLCLPQLAIAEPQAGQLRAEYDRISGQFAEAVGDWRPEPPATGSLLFVAPDQYAGSGPDRKELREAREKYAKSLFVLARRAAEAGQCSLAFQWATEVLREDPEHVDARRVLGYVRRDGKWLTAFGAKMYETGKTWDAARGWVATNGGKPKTVSTAEAKRRADIKNGWEIRTDHFAVTTNHSPAAGVELAARLERLYQIWRQLFAGFYYSEGEVRGLFAGERIARVPVRQFRVYYHRDRDDYIKTLRRREPMIGGSLGAYFDSSAAAHFFAEGTAADGSAAGETIATLYHEAVHQLFQESKPAARRIGETGNFWVIEGVATYFETLSEHRSAAAGLYYTIGEAAAGRLPAARERLQDNYYIPLAELVRLGKYETQQRNDVAKIYSQSSGLAAFLIDGEQGRYREPMVRYLQAVYTRKDNDQTLSEATGASYSDLDAAYRRFMESLP